MRSKSRRHFLAEVGQGMMIATVGYGAAVELGLSPALADDVPGRLSFGANEALVALMQETPPEQLLPTLVDRLRAGVALKDLVAAGALANARSFGGDDYVGFHAFMALAPAWQMAQELPSAASALPVLKVLYRNTSRIQESGANEHESLHPVEAGAVADFATLGEQIRQAVHAKDLAGAERLLTAAAKRSPEEALNNVLPTVAEAADVHRTVLAYRSWDLLELVGREHAGTFLRQSLHYCIDACKPSYESRFAEIRQQLPKLLDQYHLVEREPGMREADDAWVASMSESLYSATAEQAADAVAAALAEGISADSVAEAIALAANQLVLRDSGRTERQAQSNKPTGSVHGDSIGVHACDSINAWRNIARVSNRRNSMTSLILSAWQMASDRGFGGAAIVSTPPRPSPEEVGRITVRDAPSLVRELDAAIRNNDQERACAVTKVYGDADYAPQAVLDLLLRHAVSADGALHAEKFYRTATQEFGRTRPRFRWRQLIALARVTASQYGWPAAGVADAERLLAS